MFIIEQYTGLKDRNGVEIYVGDIVKSRGVDYDKEVFYDEYTKVVFKNGQFSTIGPNTYGGVCLAWECESVEVIGNIHEY